MRISDWSSDVCSSDLVAGKIFALSYKIICCRNQLSRLLGCNREVGAGECSTEILGDLCGFLGALDESEVRLRSCLEPSDVDACRLVEKIEVDVERRKEFEGVFIDSFARLDRKSAGWGKSVTVIVKVG